MKSRVLILLSFFLFLLISSEASAQEWVECSLTVNHSGHSYRSTQKRNTADKAQSASINTACSELCKNSNNKSDCSKSCLNNAVFSTPQCFDSHDRFVKFDPEQVRKLLTPKTNNQGLLAYSNSRKIDNRLSTSNFIASRYSGEKKSSSLLNSAPEKAKKSKKANNSQLLNQPIKRRKLLTDAVYKRSKSGLML